MSTYVVGDIQGCHREFDALLAKVGFVPGKDALWLAGDLVNRGPDNVAVLDLVMSLPRVTMVLGNHDLHFLAIARGHMRTHGADTVQDLLGSPRLSEYVEFLSRQPLMHFDVERNLVLVHAGLPPQLTAQECLSLSREVQAALGDARRDEFLAAMYGDEPAAWDESLAGMVRLRVITNYLTRLRYCTAVGELELRHKADVPPPGYAPWFSFPRPDQVHVLFGHWAALNGVADAPHVTALDTGCVWGRELTAVRLEDRQRFSVPAQNQR